LSVVSPSFPACLWAEGFGEADDTPLLFSYLANLFGAGVGEEYFGVQAGCSALTDDETEAYVAISTATASGVRSHVGCDDAGIALACPVSCKTNFMCAALPPRRRRRRGTGSEACGV
jgi:hypothetical protein